MALKCALSTEAAKASFAYKYLVVVLCPIEDESLEVLDPSVVLAPVEEID